jgi:hypothetical protein
MADQVSIHDPDVQTRLECLRLAIQAGGEPVAVAGQFYAFLSASSDASPKERILAALDDAQVR